MQQRAERLASHGQATSSGQRPVVRPSGRARAPRGVRASYSGCRRPDMAIRAQQVRLGAVPRRWGDLRLAPWPWRPPPLAQAVPGRAGPSSSCDRARGPGRRRTAAGRSAARARVAAAARAAAAAGGAAACSRLEPPPHACPHHPQAATATVLPTAVRLLEDINYKVRAWAGPCLRWPRHGAGSRAQAAAAARAGAAAACLRAAARACWWRSTPTLANSP